MGTVRDLLGQRFGGLVVVESAGLRRRGMNVRAIWRCLCDCGAGSVVSGNALVRGNTRSCGCKERLSHGNFRHSAYATWRRMMDRCYKTSNANYRNWGGRGIGVCRRWRESFEAFAADMGSPPGKGWSIERDDNEKGYSRENCRWLPQRDQARNTRRVIRIVHNGERLTLPDWARRFGLKPDTVHKRLNEGRPLFTPVHA